MLEPDNADYSFHYDDFCGRFVVYLGQKYMTSAESKNGVIYEVWNVGTTRYAVKRGIAQNGSLLKGLASQALG
jgi:hypothetical protein